MDQATANRSRSDSVNDEKSPSLSPLHKPQNLRLQRMSSSSTIYKCPSPTKIQTKRQPLRKTNDVSVMKIKRDEVHLLTSDFQKIVMPRFLFPENIKKGSIVTLSMERNIKEEKRRAGDIRKLQNNLIAALDEEFHSNESQKNPEGQKHGVSKEC